MAFLPFILTLCFLPLSLAQQPYINNKQLDCYNYNNDSFTNGFTCNGPQPSCLSYLTFRSQPPYYDSASTIAYLLNSDASAIARINNITDVEKIPPNSQVLVPVTCSCGAGSKLYRHNSSYILKTPSETYFSVANNTYQGLTTCQALMNQNSYDSKRLAPQLKLSVPLRCACPSQNQTDKGVKFLLSYLVTWGDSFSSIGSTFGVDQQSILDANELSATNIIFPFTTILVPLKGQPTKIHPHVPQSPQPPPPPQSPLPQNEEGSSAKKKKRVWVWVGIGIGGASFLIALLGFMLWFMLGRRRRQQKKLSDSEDYKTAEPILGTKLGSVSSQGVGYVADSLTVYKFGELEKATGNFGEDHRIKGSVYRGVIRGDNAAIKRKKISKEHDVSLSSFSRITENEINILKQINHSSVIRLSGFCVHEEEGNTYLVYEFAENGSLGDWLHGEKKNKQDGLGWKQRVQIAYDIADGLNYLHNYTNPPYIHKDLKSSNILLNGEFRGKMTNFGMARALNSAEEVEEDGGIGGDLHLTKHVVGTRGYMAPEYLENGLVTTKLDVFAFGVVMLELVSGREAASGEGEVLLSTSIKQVLQGENVRENLKGFIDPSLQNRYPLDSAFSMAHLAMNCVAQDLNSRPTMSQVFVSLSKILSSSLDWDPSDEQLEFFSRSVSHGR